jgi:hypothetical protein
MPLVQTARGTPKPRPRRLERREHENLCRALFTIGNQRFPAFPATQLSGLAEELAHDLARSGDYRRHQFERVEHQSQMFVINPAQVFVAG